MIHLAEYVAGFKNQRRYASLVWGIVVSCRQHCLLENKLNFTRARELAQAIELPARALREELPSRQYRYKVRECSKSLQEQLSIWSCILLLLRNRKMSLMYVARWATSLKYAQEKESSLEALQERIHSTLTFWNNHHLHHCSPQSD